MDLSSGETATGDTDKAPRTGVSLFNCLIVDIVYTLPTILCFLLPLADKQSNALRKRNSAKSEGVLNFIKVYHKT